jgi:hypothetical protein
VCVFCFCFWLGGCVRVDGLGAPVHWIDDSTHDNTTTHIQQHPPPETNYTPKPSKDAEKERRQGARHAPEPRQRLDRLHEQLAEEEAQGPVPTAAAAAVRVVVVVVPLCALLLLLRQGRGRGRHALEPPRQVLTRLVLLLVTVVVVGGGGGGLMRGLVLVMRVLRLLRAAGRERVGWEEALVGVVGVPGGGSGERSWGEEGRAVHGRHCCCRRRLLLLLAPLVEFQPSGPLARAACPVLVGFVRFLAMI